MEWLKRMCDSLEYMENHMEKDIDINEAARVACSSVFHFQRMFHMVTGVTVAEYIRKRRLTFAAQELASSNVKVIDVSLKYGYDSPESFAKAFRKVHGISPSAAREPGVNLRAFPPISFHISLKGDKDMNYRIIEKGAFKVLGKSIRVSTKDGENFRRIPKFWDECMQDGSYEKLCSIANGMSSLGICMEFDQQQEALTYVIAIEKQQDSVVNGFVEKEIPASTWAVFESVGPIPGSIQKVWERIYSEWFPATGYEHAGGPELEVYPEGDSNKDDYKCEVWIPIIKR